MIETNNISEPNDEKVIDENKVSCDEQPSCESHGDFVKLVWMIEKLRRRADGCSINKLVMEAKNNFSGLEHLKIREN